MLAADFFDGSHYYEHLLGIRAAVLKTLRGQSLLEDLAMDSDP